ANREVALFTYVSLLDIAALVLVSLYPWVRALTVAFFGTLFLYIGWFSALYSKPQMPRTVAFITFFLLLFAVVPLLRRWRDRGIAFGVILVLPFVNAFVYFAELSWIIDNSARLAKYAIVLSAFFLVLGESALAGRRLPGLKALTDSLRKDPRVHEVRGVASIRPGMSTLQLAIYYSDAEAVRARNVKFFDAYLSADRRITLLDVIPADTVSLAGMMDLARHVRGVVARGVR